MGTFDRISGRTRRARTIARASAFALVAGVASCASPSEAPRELVASVAEALTQAERMARYAEIRDAAAPRGIDHTAYLLAGIAHAETGLAHCWSEAQWACQGPDSPDCGGGPVIAGSGDGPCADQQGGLGMFQFDAGTYQDTLNAYGADVLTIAGNTSHAIDYVIHMVKVSAYTTNAETDAKALAWIAGFDPNDGGLRDAWISTVTEYYNGCKKGWSCWDQRYSHYAGSLQTVLDETGLPFWVTVQNHAPTGSLDDATCEVVRGWAQDPDAPAQSIDVHVYFDAGPGEAGARARATHADVSRPDLCGPLGSCDHGFEIPLPAALRDGAPHPVWAYAIDTGGGSNPSLPGGPKTVTCARATPPLPPGEGVKRHIVSQDVMGAWQFEALDVAPLEEATVEAYADGADLPGAPVVEQADDGTPEVWVIDGDLRRHVADPASLAAWKLADQVKKAPAAEVYAHKPGPEWRAKPFVFQGSGPAVYVLDDAPGATGGAGGGAPGDPGATPKGGPSGAVTIVSAPGSSDDGGAVTGSSCAASPGPARESAGAAFLAAAIALVARRRRTNAIGLGVAP